jgi:hypothetical protein
VPVTLALLVALAPGSDAAPVPVRSAGPSGGDRPPPVHLLTIVVRDASTGEDVPARVSVTDCEQQSAYPTPSPSGFYHAPYGVAPGYFYTRGESSLFVLEGPAEVLVSRGFEHETIVDTVKVMRDTTAVFEVERWIDMNALGLYSGDCHTHANHSGGIYTVSPGDALLMARAEGLNVINCLDQDYYFTGGPDSCSTPDCIVYMGEEHRSNVFGHSDLLGISTLIEPWTTTWWPPIMDIADSVHLQEGAAIVSAHPMSTDDFFDLETFGGTMLARELPLDVVGHKIDAYELLSGAYNSHERTIEMWHRILNCGFRLPPCTGTDAGLSASTGKPPGVYRTYVQVDGEFTYDSWLEGLVAGRTFATNGPLFTNFEVRDFAMGDSVALDAPGVAFLDGSVRVECETPLTRVDILCNGMRRCTFFAEEGQCVIDTSFVFPVNESSWVSARASGPRVFAPTEGESLHAHSGPVYFTLNGARILEPQCAQELVEWTDDFERLVLQNLDMMDPGQSTRIFAEIAAARDFYAALASGAATGVDCAEAEVGGVAWLAPARPNPFRSDSELAFSVPAECHVRLDIFTPSGRLVRTLLDDRFPAGHHVVTWDGASSVGVPCCSGVYLCRLSAGSDAVGRKVVLMH